MSPDPIIGFLFMLFLPFFLLALLGNIAGLRPHQSLLPVRLVAMAIWNLAVFAFKIISEILLFFLASRTFALGRKKVRIRLNNESRE